MNYRLTILTALAVCTNPTERGFAHVIFVPEDEPAIQQAISSAVSGDTILVSPGLYPQSIDFLGKNIVIEGTGYRATVIDARGDGAAVRFTGAESGAAVLQGFVIRGGSNGGILCEDSAPTIRRNWIESNHGTEGGAITMRYSVPRFEKCWITNNRATDGGTVHAIGSELYFYNCTWIDNRASGDGGGAHLTDCILQMRNCVVADNTADGVGGALFMKRSDANIKNCTFAENQSLAGGGFYLLESGPSINSCIIWNNTPDGIYNESAASVPTVNYTDIQGDWPGFRNFDLDPMFRPFRSYKRVPGIRSPCVDAGDPALSDGTNWPIRYGNSLRADMGAYGGPGNIYWLPESYDVDPPLDDGS